MNINSKQMEILEKNFDVCYHEKSNYVELESFTDAGVDMFICLELDKGELVNLLQDWIDGFDIDEEMMIYMEDSSYRNDIGIVRGVRDFQEWVEFIQGVIDELKEAQDE